MNRLSSKFPKFARQCFYRRLQLRYLALHFLLFRIRCERIVTRFCLQVTILALQFRNAVLYVIHENYPFLF